MHIAKINENSCFAIELSKLNLGVRCLTIDGEPRKKVHKSSFVELPKELQILIGSFLDCSSTMAYRATCKVLKKIDKRLFLQNEKMVSTFLKKTAKKPIPSRLFDTILSISSKITYLDLSVTDSFRLGQDKNFDWPLLSQFANVKELSLAGHALVRDREIETVVQSFPHLMKINLKGCYKISANGFDALLTLAKLQEVVLCSTFTDQISYRGDISQIEEPNQTILRKVGPYIKKLDLWLNIEAVAVRELGKCFPNLNDLRFSFYQKAATLAEIPLAFPNLSTLVFVCKESDEINEELRGLQTLQKLEKLRLQRASLDTSSMHHLAELSNLTYLYIDNCTKASLKLLSKLINLRELAISSLNIDDESIEAIGKLVNLETLHIPIGIDTSPQAFASLLKLKRLERLHLYGDINHALLPLFPKIENLKELVIERSSFSFSRKLLYNLKLPKNLIYLTLITQIVGLTSFEKRSFQEKCKQVYPNLCEILFSSLRAAWKGKTLL